MGSITPKPGLVTGHRELHGYQLPMAGPTTPAWVEVLRRCGLPLHVVLIDFETYFDKEYSMGQGGNALGTIEFIKDPRFEILSVAITRMDGATPFTDHDQNTNFAYGEDTVAFRLKYLQLEYGQNLEQCIVVAQNSQFDMSILAYRFGIYPPHMIDVLGLARAWNAREHNDLDRMCKRWGLKEKGDTKQFTGVTFRQRFTVPKGRKKGPKLPVQVPVITPEQIEALAVYNRGDNLREWELFTILLPLLSNPQTELRIMQHTLELFTKPVLRVDPEKGTELVRLYNEQLDSLIPVGLDRPIISGDKSFENLLCAALEECGDQPQKYYKPCKRGYMLALAKNDPEREVLLKHSSLKVQHLMKARIGLDSWPLHIGRVNRIMKHAAANDGVLPVPLKYHGAHTGRWSGGERINLHNLSSRGEELLTRIRNIIIAPAGYCLPIVDLASIEARVLAWIAGQLDLIEKFKNGEEIYCGFAAKVLGYPVRKPRKSGGIPSIEQRMAWARNSIGKIGILGCGYGMGGDKTEGYAKGSITNETAHKIVQTYRAEHPDIVKFWKDIEDAFAYTLRYRRPCQLPRGLQFHSDPNCDVVLTLPNGRELHYHQVEMGTDDKGRNKLKIYNAKEHTWEFTWGGTLTENVVQAMSRDIIAEAILRLEDKGLHTAHHIHDEVVLCVPQDQGEAALKTAIEELSTTPTWAPGLPLGAEGVVSQCYGKH